MSLGFNKSPSKKQLNGALNRQTLPSLTNSATSSLTTPGKTKAKSDTENYITDFSLRQYGADVHLSGILDDSSTSSLFSELHAPIRPVPICVRCSAVHASVCMPCCELICENTLTFYRKTRAAGAAALFTKAFVEAGNSKLVKFFIFRLLKNSFEMRARKKQKMKSVVERLFGTNILFEPFAAWRRYTKANIVERKERTIAQLNEKIKDLEGQINKLFTDNGKQADKILMLEKQSDMQSVESKIHNYQIQTLKDMLMKERKRVLGLSALAEPLMNYSQLVQTLIDKESNGVCQYLRNSSTTICSHNFSNIYKPTILMDIKKANKDYETLKMRAPTPPKDDETGEDGGGNINNNNESGPNEEPELDENGELPEVPTVTSNTIKKILLDWLVTNSYNAGQHVDPASGRSLSLYLPTTEKLTDLTDLRTGRHLLRTVVNLITEFSKQSETARIVESSSVAQTPAMAKAVGAMKTTRQSYHVSTEELTYIKSNEFDPAVLVKTALNLAKTAFRIPNFSANDILEGNKRVIYSLVIHLMMVSDPIVHSKEVAEVNESIHKYHELHVSQEKIQEAKEGVTHLVGIANMLESHHNLEDHQKVLEKKADKPVLNHEMLDRFNRDPHEILHSLFPSIDHSYNHLTSAVDLFLERSEQKQLNTIAKEDLQCSQQLFELLNIAAVSKEKRDNGIRMTSEIKQFLLFNFFETSAQQMGLAYG